MRSSLLLALRSLLLWRTSGESNKSNLYYLVKTRTTHIFLVTRTKSTFLASASLQGQFAQDRYYPPISLDLCLELWLETFVRETQSSIRWGVIQSNFNRGPLKISLTYSNSFYLFVLISCLFCSWCVHFYSSVAFVSFFVFFLERAKSCKSFKKFVLVSL